MDICMRLECLCEEGEKMMSLVSPKQGNWAERETNFFLGTLSLYLLKFYTMSMNFIFKK